MHNYEKNKNWIKASMTKNKQEHFRDQNVIY